MKKQLAIVLIALFGATNASFLQNMQKAKNLLQTKGRQVSIRNEDCWEPEAPEVEAPASGIIAAVASQTAASATEEHVCYKDTSCADDLCYDTCAEYNINHTDEGCRVRKKKVAIDGEICYNYNSDLQAASAARTVSEGKQTTEITATAEFTAADLVNSPCPVSSTIDVSFETPDDFCYE